MDIIAKISEELGIRRQQAEAAVKLIDEEIPSRLSHVTARRQPVH